MRIIFFGTSDFAVPSLKEIKSSGHDLLAVITQPDRKKGRRLIVTAPAVKSALKDSSIPIHQPSSVSSPDMIDLLRTYNAELFVVVAFGQILKKEVLSIPKKFCVNLHGSLLPRYRGPAPINWAIINGERLTGVTTMRMNEKMDEGDIILKKEIEILDRDTSQTLSGKLSNAGARLLIETIDLIEKDKVKFTKQNEKEATYAKKIKKEDGLINWSMEAKDIHNRVRGFVPWPGAYTHWKGKLLKVWESDFNEESVKKEDIGKIIKIEDYIKVGTKRGGLIIRSLQLEGGRRLNSDEFLRGHRLKVGDKFE